MAIWQFQCNIVSTRLNFDRLSRIEFIYIDNILDEISCRLDLRSLTKNNLISLIEYVQEIGAMFLVGDKIYSPRMEEIIGVMKKSRANRFCKNPVEYILSQNEKLEI